MNACLVLSLLPPFQHSNIPDPLPPRDYQPKLLDPGLHGGRPKFANDQDGTPGDVTPDGRVIVFYRKVFDPQKGVFRAALQAAAFDPDLIQTSGNNLSGFYTPGTGEVVGPETMWGTDYAISDQNDTFVLHYSPPTLAGNQGCPTGDCPPLDLSYMPDGSSNATLTLAMRPLVDHPAKGANPFPSNGSGAYSENGAYRTYELFMVTTHFGVDAQYITCDNGPTTQWQCVAGVWTFRGKGVVQPPILGSRNITVVVDESVQPHRVHFVSATAFMPLKTTGNANVIGTEPTITADGQLLLYHGDGGDNATATGKITYVYNPASCSVTGWTFPKSITAMNSTEPQSFKDRYPLARFPIREPDASGNYFSYGASDKLEGPYPWVDKDGSFFMSAHTYSWEGNTNNRATRSNLILCGEITGGYVKHIDDVALNPTRQGGYFDWPLTGVASHDAQRDSQMTTFFSTGLKPSLWEPFLGEDVPVPTMQAGQRIPVLPVWVHRTRLYGEVRCEEADGNYLLYLACNEAFRRNGNPIFPSVVDEDRTPDTSGRSTRATASLIQGASFPQEAWGDPDEPDPTIPGVTRMNAEALRKLISPQADPIQSHENIGFKGQAILFPTKGAVQIDALPAHGNEITVQAFVKAMRTWNSQVLKLVTSTGRFELRLNAQGKFIGQVTVVNNGVTVNKTVASRVSAINGQPNEFNPAAGWRHVAMTFDGDSNGSSVLRLYLDGQQEDGAAWGGVSTFPNPTPDVYVGPRISTGSEDPQSAVLVLDEVAISDVVRTVGELRRDAFVAQAVAFEHTWPAEADYPLPKGLSADDVFWPVGVTYDSRKVDLGRMLFADTILSGTGTVEGSTKCATCHEVGDSFAESIPKALDVNGTPMLFNTPTLLNAAFGTVKMFDGRAASLEAQVVLPLTSGSEMGAQTINDVLARLAADSGTDTDFDGQFRAIYGAAATQATLGEVLAMYQRTLNSGNSAFDNGWHPGTIGIPGGGPLDPELTASQRVGRALFFGKARCFGCHRGASLSDGDFHNVHTVVAAAIDGRGGFTGRAAEIGKLKTPTLRNVAKTGPYFHDGSRGSLEDVVDHYNDGFLSATAAKGPLDRTIVPLGLSATEKAQLVDFLEALSGTDPQ